jgi:hypothetical protein
VMNTYIQNHAAWQNGFVCVSVYIQTHSTKQHIDSHPLSYLSFLTHYRTTYKSSLPPISMQMDQNWKFA